MKKPAGKAGRASPADEDDDLWSHTAQSIKPLKKAKARFHPAAERETGATLRPRVKVEPEPVKAKTHKPGIVKPEPLPVLPKPTAAPPIATFDRKKARDRKSVV